MIGAHLRNAVLVLAMMLWVALAWDLNTNILARFSGYISAEQIAYYLIVPAVVIAVSSIALLLRWRRHFAGADAVLIAAPILFLPIYVIPLQ